MTESKTQNTDPAYQLRLMKFRYYDLKRRHRKLLKDYNVRLTPSTEGIRRLTAEDDKSRYPSTTRYSLRCGDYKCVLLKTLLSEGIVKRVRNHLYIADPEKHGHLVVYRAVPAFGGPRNCLYWNEAGIEFRFKRQDCAKFGGPEPLRDRIVHKILVTFSISLAYAL